MNKCPRLWGYAVITLEGKKKKGGRKRKKETETSISMKSVVLSIVQAKLQCFQTLPGTSGQARHKGTIAALM